jgi:hypothetical protein
MPRRSEWTLAAAVIAAGLNWLVGFQFSALTTEQAAWIMVAVNAVAALVVALRTRPIAPQAFTYAITSLAGLLAAYGLHFSQGSVATFSALVLAVLALITRGQVSPVSDALHTGVLGRR